ncbi:MAG: DUF2807 domain-containing protein [Prevotellaceae bacterium]|nr:DUF2807 domain-containing protein [Prevotellaceae bacterium]
MKTMKATITLCLLCLSFFCFAGSACASGGIKSETETVKGNGTYVTKDIPVTQFTGIKIKCKADVVYTQQADDATLQVCTSDNLMDLLDIRVEEGTLVIDFKKGTQVSYSKLEVSASSLTLENIVLSGSGSALIPDGLQTDSFECVISGSGKVETKSLSCGKMDVAVKGSGKIAANALTADEVKARLAGSGNLVMDGTSERAGDCTSGSGKIVADELTADEVKASIEGSGSITCHADKLLKVNCPGSGKVGYKGSPLLKGDAKKVYKL